MTWVCLAMAIYFEARSEDIEGQLAVAHTILNRVEASQFPDTVCDVVYQGKYKGDHPIKYQCQFTFWCDGKPQVISNGDSWSQAVGLSVVTLMGFTDDPTGGATHYHADYVNPSWASHGYPMVSIGKHLFYRL